jgi:phage terminase small subunit
MSLTAKQEAFCQAIADGMTQADAYRAAYSAGSMKPDVIHVKASQLMANGKVAVRVAELKDALAEKALWTRADSVDVLKEIAQSGGSPEAARVSSIKELNAMHGFNQPAKVDLNHKGISKIVLEAVDDDSDG